MQTIIFGSVLFLIGGSAITITVALWIAMIDNFYGKRNRSRAGRNLHRKSVGQP